MHFSPSAIRGTHPAFFTLCFSLAWVVIARAGEPAAKGPKAPGTTLRVAALIEGLTDLIVEPGAVYWEHKRGRMPGTEVGKTIAKEPTVVNGHPWLPTWQGKRSNAFRVRDLPRSFTNLTCLLTQCKARCPVGLLELLPGRIVVRFNDWAADAADYEVELLIARVDELSFDQALAAGYQAIGRRDLVLARNALRRALATLPTGDGRDAAVDRLYSDVMERCVAAASAAYFDGAGLLLALAHKLRPESQDVQSLQQWLKVAGKPVFADDFRDTRLRGWRTESGNWKVDDERLTCVGSGIITIEGARPKDFILTLDMVNGPREVGFRIGAQFRRTLRRYLTFELSTEYAGIAPGASEGAEGITFKNATKEKFVAETERLYHVMIRCSGQSVDCYLDDQLVVQGTDEMPTEGAIALHAGRADAAFDSVAIYRIVPMPQLTPPKK